MILRTSTFLVGVSSKYAHLSSFASMTLAILDPSAPPCRCRLLLPSRPLCLQVIRLFRIKLFNQIGFLWFLPALVRIGCLQLVFNVEALDNIRLCLILSLHLPVGFVFLDSATCSNSIKCANFFNLLDSLFLGCSLYFILLLFCCLSGFFTCSPPQMRHIEML